MRSKRFAVLALSAVLALTLWGCGSNRDGGPIASGEGTSLDTAQTVGINNCVTCHANYQAVKDWIDPTNPHAYNTEYSHFSESICVTCHDSTGDGHRLPETPFAGLGATTIPTLAQALEERPVVGCEACHGGGQYHRGVGPIPYAQPDPDRCGQCHDKQWDSDPALVGHKTKYHVQGYGILTDYQASPHAGSVQPHNYATGSTTDVKPVCSRCHTDQGVRKYKDVTGTEEQVDAALENEPNVADASPVQCRTCHNPHNTSKLLQDATTVTDPNDSTVTVTIDAEVNTCTTCHQRYGASHHGEPHSYEWSGHAYGDGTFSGGGIIYDTHKIMAPIEPLDPAAADAADYVTAPGALNTNVVLDADGNAVITGYAINPDETNARGGSAHGSNMGPCADCHNVHAADNTINDEWEHSAHAGHLGQAKDEAQANNTGADAPLALLTAGTSEHPFAGSHDFAAGSIDCQHCHTSTGAKNYLNDPVAYNSAVQDFKNGSADSPNDYSYLGDLSNPTHGREMIQCWACHNYNQGSLRAPGAIAVDYLDATGTAVTFPDDGPSNVCISCHTGRNNGQNIKDNFDAGKNFGSYNSHYLSAAGTIYKTTGYEFTGQDYSNPAYYEHDKIGTVDADGNEVIPGTGTNGPCVTCHMSDDSAGNANHRYSPFELDASNEPMDDNPAQICAVCHNGTHAWTQEKFAAQAEGYGQALTVLADALAANGIYYGSGYPYFYSDAGLTTRYTGWANADILGAAFNLNLLKNEPGAFAHNRYYAKRLIFDSLDFLDNGALDGTITIDPATYPEAAGWFAADATTGGAARP